MARLYDQVLATGAQVFSGLNARQMAWADGAVNAVRPGLTVLVADNVARFFSENYKEREFSTDDLHELAPNIAPPFDEFWIEARTRGPERDGLPAQFGALVRSLEASDLGDEARRKLALQDPAPRWLSYVDVFEIDPQVHRPFLSGSLAVPITESGVISGGAAVAPTPWGEDGPGILFRIVTPLFLALSFMHCKNVQQREVEQPMWDRREWKRKHKQPLVRYRVLDIDPMRKVLRTEGRSDEVGLKKALHICRGHFVTYTEDAPLFGKVAGTFWKPQHVRGSAQSGAVVKDYRIKAPK